MRISTWRRRLTVVAVVLLTIALSYTLATPTRTRYIITGDWAPPPGYTGGGFRCDTPITVRPFMGIAVLVVVLGLGASVWLWHLMRPKSSTPWPHVT
jgi:hypothetical protein